MAGSLIIGVSTSAAPISDRFSSTGVKAGTAKRFQVLSTLPAKAVSEINSRYGNVSRSMSVVSASLSGSRAKPGANTQVNQGAATMARAVISASTAARLPHTALSSSRISSRVRVVEYSDSTGTKA